jgi:hypothetical protein
MKSFRLPRKIKKRIKREFYFYPMDPVHRTYLVAWPRDNQQDYDAWKNGILMDLHKQIVNKK